MTEQNNCYIHKDTPTRLSCTTCGRAICQKCMREAAVGFKCPECASANKSHVEIITDKQYVLASLSGLLVGSAMGFIWSYFKGYGLFINLLIAYMVGFCISRSITKVIGSKIGIKIQILAGAITVISLVYNPIFLIIALGNGSMDLVGMLLLSTLYGFSSFMNVLAIIIAVWAAIRHFKF